MAKTSRIVRFARHDQRTIFLDHIENICRHSQRLVCRQGLHIAKLPCVIGKSIRKNRPWWQCRDGPGRWPIECLRAIVRTRALRNKLSTTGRRENPQHFLDTAWRHQHTSWNLQPLSLSDPGPKELIRNFGRITARYCQRASIQQKAWPGRGTGVRLPKQQASPVRTARRHQHAINYLDQLSRAHTCPLQARNDGCRIVASYRPQAPVQQCDEQCCGAAWSAQACAASARAAAPPTPDPTASTIAAAILQPGRARSLPRTTHRPPRRLWPSDPRPWSGSR